MTTTIAVQMTSRGLLIPRASLGDWSAKELEAVWEEKAIVIRPSRSASTPVGTRPQVRHMLREAGMLYETGWEMPPPVSSEERARLAKKLAQGQPLSEIIIADREDRV